MENTPRLFMVNALMRQALVAVEEVMGRNGLTAVLRASDLDRYIDQLPPNDLTPAVSAADYARLNEAIENFYGRGARGILQRVGKASFEYGLREQSALLGLAGIALKVLPPRQRIQLVLNNMAAALKKINPQDQIDIDTSGGPLAYVARTCSVCQGRRSAKPVCHLYVGSITEAVRWATGHAYLVRETDCRASGAGYCRFEVAETPA